MCRWARASWCFRNNSKGPHIDFRLESGPFIDAHRIAFIGLASPEPIFVQQSILLRKCLAGVRRLFLQTKRGKALVLTGHQHFHFFDRFLVECPAGLADCVMGNGTPLRQNVFADGQPCAGL